MGLLPRESIPSGSVAPSWLLSPPSRRCGSPSRSSTKPVQLLSTANASKQHQHQQKKQQQKSKHRQQQKQRENNRQAFVCYRELFGSIQYIFLLFRLYSRFFFYLTRLALQNTKTAK